MKRTTHLTAAETAAWLKERDDFLILTHRRPDGDTLGSAAGLCAGLRKIGKRAYVLANPETTKRYQCLTAAFNPESPAPDTDWTVITVDTASKNMLAANAAQYAACVDLCIDHHASNTEYAAYSCVDSSSAACGEIVYNILSELLGTAQIPTAAADALYVALSTDTGCFAYANVTSETLTIAGQLVALGANHKAINKELFRTKSRARIALDGALYSDLRYAADGQLAMAIIPQVLLVQTGATEDDLDDIAALPGQIAGVRIGITVREIRAGGCKISVRTSGGMDANVFCQKFGGGGHPLAAGCFVNAAPEAAAVALMDAATAALETSAL